jgi:NitT/TauT family transport system permease protein
MTTDTMSGHTFGGLGFLSPQGRFLPVLTVLAVIVVLWYALAVGLNRARVAEQLAGVNPDYTVSDLIKGTWSMERPVLPSPDQIAVDLYQNTDEWFRGLAKLWVTASKEPTFGERWEVFSSKLKNVSKKSLIYHAGITASATIVGFVFGALLGIVLAAGIVHVRTLDRSLMPWIIASQTVPILAIAPMIIVVLGSMGVTGLIPKAIISMYLGFFPVAIGMVKGLRSPDPLQLDLMRTYNATRWQVFWKLRVPASIPFLFTSLKVAIAISLVGAIVGELPTGAQGGLGSRMLSGSYYGQMVQVWSALVVASILGMLLVYAIAGIEWATLRRSGDRA